MPAILFLPCRLYYATWKIIFDADGIQKQLFGINCKNRPWTQVKEVRSAWSTSDRSYGICIIFKDRKAVHFRMDCENAEAAKRLILSYCSIREHRGSIWAIYLNANRSALRITIIPPPEHISLRSVPQIVKKSSGLTVGANCVRPPMWPCRILEWLWIMKSKS